MEHAKQSLMFAVSVILITNGIHSYVYPPKNRLEHCVNMAGIPVGIGLIYTNRPVK